MANLIKKSDVLSISPASFSFALIGTLILLIGTILTKVQGSELVGLMLGDSTSATLLEASHENIISTIDTVLSNNILGRSTVFGLWMLVGLLVFVVITAVQRGLVDIKEIEEDLESTNINKQQFLTGLTRDILFRAAMAVAWVLFVFIWLQLIVPFFVAAIFILFGSFAGLRDVAIAIVATLLLVASFQVHVVFTRLLAGRIRLFGT